MIRSLGILGIVLGSLAFIIIKPPIGVLMWTWISVMNPHRLSYGFVYNFPLAYMVALATLVGWVISREPKKLPMHPLVVLLVLYVMWVTVTSVFAVYYDPWTKWTTLMKILIFTFLTLSLMNTPNRLKALIWINVLCIGYFAVKGGLTTVVSAGTSRVWGPPDSFIADNNHLALAMVMSMPLLRYLQLVAKEKYMRWGMGAALFLWLLAILGTQSRGAFIAMGCMLFFMWLKSKQKFYTGIFMGIAVLLGVIFMPQSWHQRMESIENYEQDASFMGRVAMWNFALKTARDNPVTGGGFDVFYDEGLRARYLEPGETGRAVHNIYFEVLGEHGYIGLALFLAIGTTAFFTCGRMMRLTAKRPDLYWANRLGAMLQVCLVGYAVNGMTLNLATFDLFYTLIAMVVLARVQLSRALAEAPIPPEVTAASQGGKWAPPGAVTTS